MGKHESRVSALESRLNGAQLNIILLASERDLMSRYGIRPTGRDPDMPGHYHLSKGKHPGEVVAVFFDESDMALL